LLLELVDLRLHLSQLGPVPVLLRLFILLDVPVKLLDGTFEFCDELV